MGVMNSRKRVGVKPPTLFSFFKNSKQSRRIFQTRSAYRHLPSRPRFSFRYHTPPLSLSHAHCPTLLHLEPNTIMASAVDVDELIARPLEVIARLRVELKARDSNSDSGGESALLAKAISDILCSGISPALDKVPVLSRGALAEVCVFAPTLLCVESGRGGGLVAGVSSGGSISCSIFQ